MSHSFKPQGYNSVSPYFILDDAQQFIYLMEKIFNATVLRRFNTDGNKIMHAEIKIDDSVIMFADATDKYPAIELVMHVYVNDSDAIFKKAIEAGCEVVQEPKQQEGDPDRRGTFKDPFGNLWSVSTQAG